MNTGTFMEVIEALAAGAQLRRQGPVVLDARGALCEYDATLFESSYASVLAIDLSGADEPALDVVHRDAHAWFLEHHEASPEQPGRRDYYLVIGISAQTVGTRRTEIQKLELDTTLARKTIVWPTPDGDWRPEVLRVPVLALPTRAGAAGDQPEAAISPETEELVSWLDADSAASVHKTLEEQITKEVAP